MQSVEEVIAIQNPDGRLPCLVETRARGLEGSYLRPVIELLEAYEGTGNGGESFAWQVEDRAQHELFTQATECLGTDTLPESMSGELVCVKQTGRLFTARWIMPRAGL